MRLITWILGWVWGDEIDEGAWHVMGQGEYGGNGSIHFRVRPVKK